MIRDKKGSASYWNEWVEYAAETIIDFEEVCASPSNNPSYHPQFLFEIAKKIGIKHSVVTLAVTTLKS